MKINMFEGARRIAKLMAVIWAAGWCIDAFTNSTYIHAYFRVDAPVSTPIRMENGNDCDTGDAEEHLYSQYTRNGTKASLTLCFKPMTFNNGKTLIPYRVDEATHMTWGDESYTTNVSDYTKRVASNFKLTKADEEWIDSKVWPARWEKSKEGALAIIGGLAFLWVFSWGVGWIVRGFAGIPTGHDRKPEDTPPPA